MTVEGGCLCCFGFVGVFFGDVLLLLKKTNPTQSINAATQPSTVKAQLMEQLNFTLGDRIFKCDFSQKKQYTKLYQTFHLAEVTGKLSAAPLWPWIWGWLTLAGAGSELWDRGTSRLPSRAPCMLCHTEGSQCSCESWAFKWQPNNKE